MDSKIIVANWKMNGNLESARDLCLELGQKSSQDPSQATVVICPPFVHLGVVAQRLLDTPLLWGAQDCSSATEGAFTGQISADMVKELGCGYVILGHSERRTLLNESNDLIRQKAQQALKVGLTPIICVGENKQQRDQGEVIPLILDQVKASLPDPQASCLIAYEPLWAIGTGVVATSTQIAEIHQALADHYPTQPLLYGGSVKASNAKEILEIPHVDGLLVGGASLKAEEFWNIVKSAD